MVAHDLHPEYLSTKWALAQDGGVELVGVQHHHAHLAACLAEHGEAGPVIGIACDGLGYGTDGALWGGEVLDVSLAGFTPARAPGAGAAARRGHRDPAAVADRGRLAAGRRGRRCPGWPVAGSAPAWSAGAAAAGLAAGRCPRPPAPGRLFDAVAALLGVRDRVNYEGQAAIELEQLADRGRARRLPGRPCGRR